MDRELPIKKLEEIARSRAKNKQPKGDFLLDLGDAQDLILQASRSGIAVLGVDCFALRASFSAFLSL